MNSIKLARGEPHPNELGSTRLIGWSLVLQKSNYRDFRTSFFAFIAHELTWQPDVDKNCILCGLPTRLRISRIVLVVVKSNWFRWRYLSRVYAMHAIFCVYIAKRWSYDSEPAVTRLPWQCCCCWSCTYVKYTVLWTRLQKLLDRTFYSIIHKSKQQTENFTTLILSRMIVHSTLRTEWIAKFVGRWIKTRNYIRCYSK